MFTQGDVAQGCGHATRTVGSGFRATAANYVTKQNQRKNLTILTKTLIDKVNLEKKDGGYTADSVEVVLDDGSRASYKAKKEIVLSAGAYGTPAILLRSGIGAKNDVERHGITHHVELPGIGKNLQDHLVSNWVCI